MEQYLGHWAHNQITKYNNFAQKVLHVNWVVENQRYPPRAWVQGYKHIHISTIKRPYQLLGSLSSEKQLARECSTMYTVA